jgi:hypothetical protein
LSRDATVRVELRWSGCSVAPRQSAATKAQGRHDLSADLLADQALSTRFKICPRFTQRGLGIVVPALETTQQRELR